jgi:hypothetical protein
VCVVEIQMWPCVCVHARGQLNGRAGGGQSEKQFVDFYARRSTGHSGHSRFEDSSYTVYTMSARGSKFTPAFDERTEQIVPTKADVNA